MKKETAEMLTGLVAEREDLEAQIVSQIAKNARVKASIAMGDQRIDELLNMVVSSGGGR